MALLRKKDGVIGKVLSLPIDSISPNPNQPRRRFAPEELQELADSIHSLGVLQPLTVRAVSEGRWQLIAGERRLRAAQMAGLTHGPWIPAQCRDVVSSLLALVENLQRSDLDFWEEAQALYRLIHQFDLSQEACARQLGKSQSALANKLRLLRLPEEALRLLRDNGFTERHARALLRLKDPDTQEAASRWVVDHDLTVAKTEEYVESLLLQEQQTIKRRPTYILKDVRLFLNTVDRGLSMMRSAGVDAQCGREDTGEAILLTIRIPKRARQNNTRESPGLAAHSP